MSTSPIFTVAISYDTEQTQLIAQRLKTALLKEVEARLSTEWSALLVTAYDQDTQITPTNLLQVTVVHNAHPSRYHFVFSLKTLNNEGLSSPLLSTPSTPMLVLPLTLKEQETQQRVGPSNIVYLIATLTEPDPQTERSLLALSTPYQVRLAQKMHVLKRVLYQQLQCTDDCTEQELDRWIEAIVPKVARAVSLAIQLYFETRTQAKSIYSRHGKKALYALAIVGMVLAGSRILSKSNTWWGSVSDKFYQLVNHNKDTLHRLFRLVPSSITHFLHQAGVLSKEAVQEHKSILEHVEQLASSEDNASGTLQPEEKVTIDPRVLMAATLPNKLELPSGFDVLYYAKPDVTHNTAQVHSLATKVKRLVLIPESASEPWASFALDLSVPALRELYMRVVRATQAPQREVALQQLIEELEDNEPHWLSVCPLMRLDDMNRLKHNSSHKTLEADRYGSAYVQSGLDVFPLMSVSRTVRCMASVIGSFRVMDVWMGPAVWSGTDRVIVPYRDEWFRGLSMDVLSEAPIPISEFSIDPSKCHVLLNPVVWNKNVAMSDQLIRLGRSTLGRMKIRFLFPVQYGLSQLVSPVACAFDTFSQIMGDRMHHVLQFDSQQQQSELSRFLQLNCLDLIDMTDWAFDDTVIHRRVALGVFHQLLLGQSVTDRDLSRSIQTWTAANVLLEQHYSLEEFIERALIGSTLIQGQSTQHEKQYANLFGYRHRGNTSLLRSSDIACFVSPWTTTQLPMLIASTLITKQQLLPRVWIVCTATSPVVNGIVFPDLVVMPDLNRRGELLNSSESMTELLHLLRQPFFPDTKPRSLDDWYKEVTDGRVTWVGATPSRSWLQQLVVLGMMAQQDMKQIRFQLSNPTHLQPGG